MPEQRDLQLVSDFQGPALELRWLRYRDAIGRPFRLDLNIVSDSPDVDLGGMIGKPLGVTFKTRDGTERCFHGLVSSAAHLGVSGRLHMYRASVRPSLWFLSQQTNCRIFLDENIPSIIQQVAEAGGVGYDGGQVTAASFPAREFVAQYRESDFNFVSRHMEREGLVYIVKQTANQHTLVVADAIARILDSRGQLEWAPEFRTDTPAGRITDISRRFRFRPGEVVLADYNYMTVEVLNGSRSESAMTPESGYQIYDYPGKYETAEEGSHYAKVRLERLRTRHQTFTARTTSQILAPASSFHLSRHPTEDLTDEEFIVTDTDLVVSTGEHEELLGPAAPALPAESCRISFIPRVGADGEAVEFRTALKAKRPRIRGPQTAVVVGTFDEGGGQSQPDEHSRVKVRFFWDRNPKDPNQASCWIRVAENWAGKNYGTQFIPHIGHEVIVEFLEGDPDRPIITGRVYNGKNKPPMITPRDKYRTVVAQDHYGNRLVFDGTPGSERIVLHSPHHASWLVLGESIYGKTKSNENKFTIGDEHKCTMGNNTSITVGSTTSLQGGSKASFLLGAALDIIVGAKVSATIGTNVEYKAVNEMKILKGSSYVDTELEVKKAKSDVTTIADATHGLSGLKAVIVSAGGGLPGKPVSLIDMKPSEMSLSVGTAGDGAAPTADIESMAQKAAFAGLTAAALGAVAGNLAAWAGMTYVSQPTDDPNTTKNEADYGGKDADAKNLWIATGVLGTASLAAFIAQAILARKTAKVVKQKMSKKLADPVGIPKIRLSKDGVFVKHTPASTLDVSKSSIQLKVDPTKLRLTNSAVVVESGSASIKIGPAMTIIKGSVVKIN